MMKHKCSEEDMVWNPYTESLECRECGRDFGIWKMKDYLMAKTNSTTGEQFNTLTRNTIKVAQHRDTSRQHVYAEYAALFFYDDLEDVL